VTGEVLPGLEGGKGMSRTDMVRCKSLVEATRLVIVAVMNDNEVEDETTVIEDTGEETDDGMNDETESAWDPEEDSYNMVCTSLAYPCHSCHSLPYRISVGTDSASSRMSRQSTKLPLCNWECYYRAGQHTIQGLHLAPSDHSTLKWSICGPPSAIRVGIERILDFFFKNLVESRNLLG
jgi:hypothetical protein